jgi:hypothetical protein
MSKLPKIVKQIQEYKTQEVNYGFHKTISYSQISMYMQCPYRWSLMYRDGHKVFTSSINTVFGTAIHETLQHYLNVMYSESGTAADKINLWEYFEDCFSATYLKEYKSNNNIHFSNPNEMREFFDDGMAILDFIKKKRGEYFSIKGWHLVGIEMPIVLAPNKTHNNILFNGFIDLVLYHEPTEKFVIYDIKTSTRGWKDKEKKDELKQSQILLYKSFFSEQFGVSEENIDVEFFIVKRKIWEESEFPQKRVQMFVPTNGKTKVKKARALIDKFIDEVFNLDGSYKTVEHEAKPDKSSCFFCPYKDKKELCDKAILG